MKLTNVNLHLARAVLVAATLFAATVTLLAALTGETMLLGGTALGAAAGGYALTVSRKPAAEWVELPRAQRTVAA